MFAQLQSLWRDEAGFIISAEMVIILTITVLGMVTGLVCLQHAILGEFADLSLAFQSLNQSYATPSYRGCWKWMGFTSWYAGSSFIDVFDGCLVGTGGTSTYQHYDSVGCEASGTGCVTSPTTGTVTTDHGATTVSPAVPSTAPVVPCPQGTTVPAAPPLGHPTNVPCQNCQ